MCHFMPRFSLYLRVLLSCRSVCHLFRVILTALQCEQHGILTYVVVRTPLFENVLLTSL